jgi:hypothetical protein
MNAGLYIEDAILGEATPLLSNSKGTNYGNQGLLGRPSGITATSATHSSWLRKLNAAIVVAVVVILVVRFTNTSEDVDTSYAHPQNHYYFNGLGRSGAVEGYSKPGSTGTIMDVVAFDQPTTSAAAAAAAANSNRAGGAGGDWMEPLAGEGGQPPQARSVPSGAVSTATTNSAHTTAKETTKYKPKKELRQEKKIARQQAKVASNAAAKEKKEQQKAAFANNNEPPATPATSVWMKMTTIFSPFASSAADNLEYAQQVIPQTQTTTTTDTASTMPSTSSSSSNNVRSSSTSSTGNNHVGSSVGGTAKLSAVNYDESNDTDLVSITAPPLAGMAELPPKADKYFSGLLKDDQAFFFPFASSTAVEEESSIVESKPANRKLRGQQHQQHQRLLHHDNHNHHENHQNQHHENHQNHNNNNNNNNNNHQRSSKVSSSGTNAGTKNDDLWSFDWKKSPKDVAAVSEYYQSKGMILMGAAHPTTMEAAEEDDTLSSKKERKFAKLAPQPSIPMDWESDKDRVTKVGETYHRIGEIIDDHYKEAYASVDDGEGRRRYLKKSKLSSTKPVLSDAVNITVPDYTWQDDWKRGERIGQLYERLSQLISAHYAGLMVNTADQILNEHLDYIAQGQNIAQSYHNKSVAINEFYNGGKSFADEDDGSAGTDASADMNAADDNDTIDAGALIEDYYDAVYDKTYKKDMLGQLPEHHPDEIYPRWGSAGWQIDREHGKAIGDYWKQYHAVMNEYYYPQGLKLSDEYAKYYEKQFEKVGN